MTLAKMLLMKSHKRNFNEVQNRSQDISTRNQYLIAYKLPPSARCHLEPQHIDYEQYPIHHIVATVITNPHNPLIILVAPFCPQTFPGQLHVTFSPFVTSP